MKIKCDLCGGELLMDAGGQTASCVNCGMKHSVERVREMLAGTSGQPTEITPEEHRAEKDGNPEQEPYCLLTFENKSYDDKDISGFVMNVYSDNTVTLSLKFTLQGKLNFGIQKAKSLSDVRYTMSQNEMKIFREILADFPSMFADSVEPKDGGDFFKINQYAPNGEIEHSVAGYANETMDPLLIFIVEYLGVLMLNQDSLEKTTRQELRDLLSAEETDDEVAAWGPSAEEPQDNDSDAEWEPLEADPLQEEEDAEWEPVLDPDESYYTKYLRFNAQLYPKSDKNSWEKIEWDIWSEGNCEFHIDFYDAAMSKLFPRDYVLCQNKKEKANGSITKRIDAIRDLYENVRWNIQLSPEQIDIVDTLLAAFNDPKTALDGMKNQGSSEYSWEMSTCYPNHDTRREFKGAVDESNETLMQLKDFLLEILLQNVSERYPWIYNIDLNH